MVFAAYRDYKRWRDHPLQEAREEGRVAERKRIKRELKNGAYRFPRKLHEWKLHESFPENRTTVPESRPIRRHSRSHNHSHDDLPVPRGTTDRLPAEQKYWRYIEGKAMDVARRFGYGRIDSPMFEDAGLFVRGVGEGTDIVEKEMYVFEDRGGDMLTLRAEGTAPVCRAYLQHGMQNQAQPVRMYYICLCSGTNAPRPAGSANTTNSASRPSATPTRRWTPR